MMYYVELEYPGVPKELAGISNEFAWVYRREDHEVYAVLERSGALVIRPEDQVQYRFPAAHISRVAEKKLLEVISPSQMFASSTFPHKEAEAQALSDILGEVSEPLRKVHEFYQDRCVNDTLLKIKDLLSKSSEAVSAMDRSEVFVSSRRKLSKLKHEETYATPRDALKSAHDDLSLAMSERTTFMNRYQALKKVVEGLSELEEEVNKIRE